MADNNFNYSFFKFGPKGTTTVSKFGNFSYPTIVAKNGYVDVTKLHWKNNNIGADYEVPSVLLTEYDITYGHTARSIFQFFEAAKQYTGSAYIDPYSNLYLGKETGFKYLLPYLLKSGDSIRGRTSNNWKRIKGLVENITGGGEKDSLISVIGGGLKDIEQIGGGFTVGYLSLIHI